MRLDEINEKKNAIRSELKRLDEDPDTTEEDHGDLRDSLVQEWQNLDERAKPIVERLERIRVIEREGSDPGNREPVDAGAGDATPATRSSSSSRRSGGPTGGSSRWSGGTGPDLVTRNWRNPFEDMDSIRARTVRPRELRERALNAIEIENRWYGLEDEYAQNVTSKVESVPGVARHVLMTGERSYLESFEEYLRDPESFVRSGRAALSLTVANGGYLLPYTLDPTVILTNNSSANPYRRVGRVVQTTSNAWQGVNSAGVTAAWVGEGVYTSDGSPTLGQIQITPAKAAAWVYGSYEVLDDTDFGNQLPKLLADARDRLEVDGFTTGSGGIGTTATAAMPKGIIAALGSGQRVAPTNGSGSATGTGFPVASDVYNVQASLPPRFRNSNSVGWMANIFYLNKLRAIDSYGGSSFWANFGSDTPEQLLGKPIYENSSMYGATGTGTGTAQASLIFGDWDQFIVVDRVGVSMLYEPMVKGMTGTGTPFPSGQAGWYMFWRTSSDVATTNAFRFTTAG